MASVWAGTNESTGKLVALKVIREGFMANPGADAFLRSEGLVASRINHPNVVTVFDVLEQAGMVCIVMELLDGLPFGTYIARRGPQSVRDAVSLLLPAMRGVAAAHAQGVVHRDLKPQNIFVCIGPDARIVTTKVLDFGISLMVDWARGNSVAAIPGLAGTPSYMAPEHIEGSATLDPRTDVYGFGVLFYEALSGRMAFPDEPGGDVLKAVLTQSPVPLRELCPDVPPGVIGIIETAMAKRPEQRFGGLNEMVHALEEQITLAAPMPMGTPASGVPTAVMSYSISSPIAIAVPSNIGKESSGPILKTQIFGQPTRHEGEPDRTTPALAGEVATPPAVPEGALAVTVPHDWGEGLPTTDLLSPGMSWFLAGLRNRRVQLAAVIGALALIVVVWAVVPIPPASSRGAPPLSVTTALPNAPIAAPPPAPPVVVPLQAQEKARPVPATEVSPKLPPSSSTHAAPNRAPRARLPKAKASTPVARPNKSPLGAGALREADF